MSEKPVCVIAAVAKNRVIGQNGQIPWSIPEDLQHFKQLTMGHTVIMGRRTFESIGRALPGRQNIVVTSSKNVCDDCQTAHSLKEAIALAEREKIFIIGGAALYAEALKLADSLELTLVDAAPEGDTFFPELSPAFYEETNREVHSGKPSFTYVTWKRIETT